MNSVWLHSHMPTHASIYFGMLVLPVQNFIWWVNDIVFGNHMCGVFFNNSLVNEKILKDLESSLKTNTKACFYWFTDFEI